MGPLASARRSAVLQQPSRPHASPFPIFFIKNSGWLRFGYRFSNDFAPFLDCPRRGRAATAKATASKALAAFAIVVNFFGALSFQRAGFEALLFHRRHAAHPAPARLNGAWIGGGRLRVSTSTTAPATGVDVVAGNGVVAPTGNGVANGEMSDERCAMEASMTSRRSASPITEAKMAITIGPAMMPGAPRTPRRR